MKPDRERWDSRYSGESGDTPSPDLLLIEWGKILTSGRALDLACGRGANSIFMAHRGYWVDALDISFVALRSLMIRVQDEGLPIGCAAVDLDQYPLPVNFYDLITVFYFFSRNLIAPIKSALKRDGLLIYATFNYNHMSLRPDFCHEYLVPPGGLGQFFPDLKRILDMEHTGPSNNISQFVGKNHG